MLPVPRKGVCYLSFHGGCQSQRPNASMLTHNEHTAVIRQTEDGTKTPITTRNDTYRSVHAVAFCTMVSADLNEWKSHLYLLSCMNIRQNEKCLVNVSWSTSITANYFIIIIFRNTIFKGERQVSKKCLDDHEGDLMGGYYSALQCMLYQIFYWLTAPENWPRMKGMHSLRNWWREGST